MTPDGAPPRRPRRAPVLLALALCAAAAILPATTGAARSAPAGGIVVTESYGSKATFTTLTCKISKSGLTATGRAGAAGIRLVVNPFAGYRSYPLQYGDEAFDGGSKGVGFVFHRTGQGLYGNEWKPNLDVAGRLTFGGSLVVLRNPLRVGLAFPLAYDESTGANKTYVRVAGTARCR